MPMPEETGPAANAAVGDVLPDLTLPLTRSYIVATAIASRDFQEVHHDPAIAQARGSTDVFMNILTSQGLVSRFVTDWSGPAATVKRNAIRLGAPNYPGDTMILSGSVKDRREFAGGCELDISVVGKNSLGDHVSGVVTISVPLEGKTR
jgi:acyl dehydratase